MTGPRSWSWMAPAKISEADADDSSTSTATSQSFQRPSLRALYAARNVLAFRINHQVIGLQKRFHHGDDCIKVPPAISTQIDNHFAQSLLGQGLHRQLKFFRGVLRKANDLDVPALAVQIGSTHNAVNGNAVPAQQHVLDRICSVKSDDHRGVAGAFEQFHDALVGQVRTRNRYRVNGQNAVARSDTGFFEGTSRDGSDHHQRILLDDEFDADALKVALHGFGKGRQFFGSDEQAVRIQFFQYGIKSDLLQFLPHNRIHVCLFHAVEHAIQCTAGTDHVQAIRRSAAGLKPDVHPQD